MTAFFERINPLSIIKNHFSTLYNNRIKRVDVVEVVLWIFLPFSLAFYIAFISNTVISDDFSKTLLSAFAILGGFFINALVLLATKKDVFDSGENLLEKRKLLRETFYNTSFGILICIIAVVFCAIYGVFSDDDCIILCKDCISYQSIISFFIYSTCFYFVLTLLMVLKRLNRILMDDFS